MAAYRKIIPSGPIAPMFLELAVRFSLVIHRRDTIKFRGGVAPPACEDVIGQPILDDEKRAEADTSNDILVVTVVMWKISLC